MGKGGKKYIVVAIAGKSQKLYLENVKKVHKNIKKSLKPIPLYSEKLLLHLESQETETDSCTPSKEVEEESFAI